MTNTSKSMLKRHAVQKGGAVTNTPMTREAFETWFLGENTHVVLQQDKDGNYLYSSAYSAWQAFNAGWQACEQQNQAVIAELVEALEEATALLDGEGVYTNTVRKCNQIIAKVKG